MRDGSDCGCGCGWEGGGVIYAQLLTGRNRVAYVGCEGGEGGRVRSGSSEVLCQQSGQHGDVWGMRKGVGDVRNGKTICCSLVHGVFLQPCAIVLPPAPAPALGRVLVLVLGRLHFSACLWQRVRTLALTVVLWAQYLLRERMHSVDATKMHL